MCFLVHDLCCIWYMYAVIYIYTLYHHQTFDSYWCVLSPIVISFPTKSLESLTSIRPSLSTMEVSV